MACRSGCRTRDHASYAECAATVHVGSTTGENRVRERAYSADMDAFKRLTRQGVELPEVAGSAFKEASGMSAEQMKRRL